MERLNLGQLIDLLKKCPPKNYVRFDFGGISPTHCDSYRGYCGYYRDLAIEFGEDASATVQGLLTTLNSAVGQVFTGWKGGDFRMDRNSRVWVANPGRTTGTVIVGIEPSPDYITILRTRYEDG
jgi:hypothetical protein